MFITWAFLCVYTSLNSNAWYILLVLLHYLAYNQRMNRVIVPISGGMDSTVLLHWACTQFDVVHAISFDYAQRHRRELVYARTKEFAPHDEVIAKQIPGQTQQAEQARQVIRDKYASIQQEIDAAADVAALKQALQQCAE